MDIKQMFADIRSSLRQGDLWRMLAAAVIITGLMSAYFLTIGIPKTAARNLHNEGLAYMLSEDYTEAKEKFQAAQEVWYTEDSARYLEQLD